MSALSGVKLWLVITLSVNLLAVPVLAVNGGRTSNEPVDMMVAKMRDTINQLLQWPSAQDIEAKRVSADRSDVVVATNQCNAWLHKVIDKTWLPADDLTPLLLRNEMDGRDVVRYMWTTNGFRIQVAQTATIFTMRLFPDEGQIMGQDRTNRLRIARDLCRRIFAKEGRRYTDQGNAVSVSNLDEKIASYSFGADTLFEFKDSPQLCGRPRTMEEAGVRKTDAAVNAQMDDNARNPDWYMTERAWNYWFHMVNWWNDGESIGVFFLKVEDGAWCPDYGGSLDRKWFTPLNYVPMRSENLRGGGVPR